MANKNPLRLDPTRSVTLLRQLGTEIGRWFLDARDAVFRFVADEDELDLAGNRERLVRRELIDNAFCPTGEGGGIDNSCSSAGVSIKSIDRGHSGLHHVLVEKDGKEIGKMSLVNRRGKDSLKETGLDRTTTVEIIVLGREYRGKGIGKAMYRQAMKTAADNGSRYLVSDRTLSDDAAKIWDSMGAGKTTTGRRYVELPMTTNAKRFAFRSNDDKVREFVRFLGETFDAKVNGKTQEGVLTRYVATMHAKGVDRAYADANRYGLRGGNKEKELMSKGGRAEFLRRAKIDPELIDRVKVLASRTYLDVQDVTRKSAGTLRRILVDGMAAGENPRAVARRMMDELDMTKVQATRIARTEMIRAHAEGQLDAFERMGIKGVSGDVEFSATKTLGGDFDLRVCSDCQDLDGEVMTLREARGIIPVHPNCRCAWKPAPEEEDEAEKEDKKAKPKLLAPARKGKAVKRKKSKPKRVVVKKRTTPAKGKKGKADSLKMFTVTFGNKVLSKKTFGKSSPPSKVRASARGGAKVVRKKLTTNAFCPTGPGGGIDNSCSSRGYPPPVITTDIKEMVKIQAQKFREGIESGRYGDVGIEMLAKDPNMKKFSRNWNKSLKGLDPDPVEAKKIQESVNIAYETYDIPLVPVFVRKQTAEEKQIGENAHWGGGFIVISDDVREELRYRTAVKPLSDARKTTVKESYPDLVAGLIVHELGHKYHDDNPYTMSNARVLVVERRREISERISSYAASHPQELIAESYAMRKHPDYASLPESTRNLVESVLNGGKSIVTNAKRFAFRSNDDKVVD